MSAAGQSRRLGVRNQKLRAPRSVREAAHAAWAHGVDRRDVGAPLDGNQTDPGPQHLQAELRRTLPLRLQPDLGTPAPSPQNQQGDMLYMGVRKQVEEHLVRQCNEQLVPLFPLDAAAASRAQDVLASKGKARDAGAEPVIAPVLGLLPDSPDTSSILAGIPAGERFLSAVTSVWDDHCSCMGKLRDVLKYVVRCTSFRSHRTECTSRTAMSSPSGTSGLTSTATRSCARDACRCPPTSSWHSCARSTVSARARPSSGARSKASRTCSWRSRSPRPRRRVPPSTSRTLSRSSSRPPLSTTAQSRGACSRTARRPST